MERWGFTGSGRIQSRESTRIELRKGSSTDATPQTAQAIPNHGVARRRAASGLVQHEEVPPISIEVLKDRDRAVLFLPRRLAEPDAAHPHLPVIAHEVVRVQEQEHAAARLAADRSQLPLVLCLGEQHAASPRARRNQEDPPPSVALRHIRDDNKMKHPRVELDGLVIVPDEEGDGADWLLHFLGWAAHESMGGRDLRISDGGRSLAERRRGYDTK